MDTNFIDVECLGTPSTVTLGNKPINKFREHGQAIHAKERLRLSPRKSYDDCRSIRSSSHATNQNPGLDPKDVELIIEFLEEAAAELSDFNSSS
jgi:hypothetical protein